LAPDPWGEFFMQCLDCKASSLKGQQAGFGRIDTRRKRMFPQIGRANCVNSRFAGFSPQ
jgi:hypothetical protein